jgi:hypothetical protein
VGGPTLAKSTLKARISGTHNEGDLQTIYSPNQYLIIVFTSDSSVSQAGFIAKYKSGECSALILNFPEP